MKQKEFNKTILPLSGKIYSYSVRILGNEDAAKDAVQDVMVRLWEKRSYILKKCDNITGFVIRTTRNHCIDQLRKHKFSMGEDEYKKLAHSPFTINDVTNNELYEIIKDIINTLPVNQKEVVILKDIEGYTNREISEITGLGMNNIRVILSRCRSKIKEVLENEYKIKNFYDE